jgi:glutamyl-tRNA synthetase
MDAGTPFVVRLKVPRNEEIRFHDIIRGWVTVNSSQVDDKVLLKSDGMPTYHLAHIVDDIEMKITHAVRGEEWLPSAPSHILIYRFLGLEADMPLLAHLPLILKPDGNGKLSKRDKSGLPMFPINWHDERTGESYIGYKESGFTADAFINMLALLGWNPGDNREILTKDELIKEFSFERVNKSGAKFDPEKTKWFNQQYLRMQSDDQLAASVTPLLEAKGIKKDTAFVKEFCRLVKEKAHFVTEFYDLGSYFFIAPTSYDEKVMTKKWNENSKATYTKLTEKLMGLDTWTIDSIHNQFTAVEPELGKIDMQLVRVLTTGVAGGAQLFDMLALLGKDEVIGRLKIALNSLS